jgi:hypothetical protein
VQAKALQSRFLAAVLEGAHAANTSLALRYPESRATMLRLPGCSAFFYGRRDPATRAVVTDPDVVTDEEIESVESFLGPREAIIRFFVQDKSSSQRIITELQRRGYKEAPILCTWWRALPASNLPEPSANIDASPVSADLLPVWARTVATGFREGDSALSDSAVEPDEVSGFCARAAIPNSQAYLAMIAGVPAGGAMLQMHDGAALIRSASTRFVHRRQGIQQALLAKRLNAASEAGCDVAFSMANKGDGSERNLRRFGFEFLQEGCILSKS